MMRKKRFFNRFVLCYQLIAYVEIPERDFYTNNMKRVSPP